MGGWQIFRIQGGWPMSDNDIFQGGFRPPRILWTINPSYFPVQKLGLKSLFEHLKCVALNCLKRRMSPLLDF